MDCNLCRVRWSRPVSWDIKQLQEPFVAKFSLTLIRKWLIIIVLWVIYDGKRLFPPFRLASQVSHNPPLVAADQR